MSEAKPPELGAALRAALASVRVTEEQIRQALADGRELRRDFEERIDEMRAITTEDLKARVR